MSTFVTGFGPFGPVADNPSGRLAQGCGRAFKVLEVAYAAADAFVDGFDPERFDSLLMLGVATRRDRITPELFARNVRSGVADVRGLSVPGPIEEGAPLLVESTLWDAGLVASLSNQPGFFASLDAGGYLCNYLSYRALRRFPSVRVGFLHVPPFDKVPEERQAAVLARVLDAIEAESV